MDNNQERKIRVAITHGDINGVGYEVIIKTFSDSRMFDICTPILYGSSKVASYHKKLLTSVTQEMNFNVIHDAAEALDNRYNVLNLTQDEIKIDLGKSTEIAGALARKSLDRACEDLKAGKVDVLVTAPINKRNIQAPDFDFPGHTEYLSHQFGASSLMLMVCDRIRIGIVTNHLALKDVPAALTHDLLINKITLLNQSLKRDFGITRPKIAVLALDPHAGDNGVIGDFDARVIMPVIDEAQANGILAYGPFPSDGFFGSEQFNKFDGVLALYHDQGLIPFKLMSFTEGVNYTAGLPYVRTSPAHGTGYDIAGKDRASEQSFRSAVYLACNILRNRQEYDLLNANPLK
ncbi:MAG: 4-hydroxythreonine-4-phosphate dehydrogenase PdxA [Bacteroidales bacterium]|nr:4-hydroxythreonine-4-phosphate dehydrogenase PdxA [Bacteroidales bacterium]